ncbi:MAG: hypothetical protein ACIAS6_04660 [Phycisphaerales bacterium JB060]
MSSLLEGIEVNESGSGSKKSSGGPDPKVIKLSIAVVLFLIAGVLIAMQFDIIPAPWGGGTVTNSQGEVIQYTPPTEAELKQNMEQLKREEEEFIKRGGTIGGS